MPSCKTHLKHALTETMTDWQKLDGKAWRSSASPARASEPPYILSPHANPMNQNFLNINVNLGNGQIPFPYDVFRRAQSIMPAAAIVLELSPERALKIARTVLRYSTMKDLQIDTVQQQLMSQLPQIPPEYWSEWCTRAYAMDRTKVNNEKVKSEQEVPAEKVEVVPANVASQVRSQESIVPRIIEQISSNPASTIRTSADTSSPALPVNDAPPKATIPAPPAPSVPTHVSRPESRTPAESLTRAERIQHYMAATMPPEPQFQPQENQSRPTITQPSVPSINSQAMKRRASQPLDARGKRQRRSNTAPSVLATAVLLASGKLNRRLNFHFESLREQFGPTVSHVDTLLTQVDPPEPGVPHKHSSVVVSPAVVHAAIATGMKLRTAKKLNPSYAKFERMEPLRKDLKPPESRPAISTSSGTVSRPSMGRYLGIHQPDIRQAVHRALNSASTHQAGTPRAADVQAGLPQASIQQAGHQQAGHQQAGRSQASVRQAGQHQAGPYRADSQQAGLQTGGRPQAGLPQANVQQANVQQANVHQANVQQASHLQARNHQAGMPRPSFQQAGIRQAEALQAAGPHQTADGRTHDVFSNTPRAIPPQAVKRQYSGNSQQITKYLVTNAVPQPSPVVGSSSGINGTPAAMAARTAATTYLDKLGMQTTHPNATRQALNVASAAPSAGPPLAATPLPASALTPTSDSMSRTLAPIRNPAASASTLPTRPSISLPVPAVVVKPQPLKFQIVIRSFTPAEDAIYDIPPSSPIEPPAQGFPVFRCDWHKCGAELHSFDNLMRHCDKLHGIPTPDGLYLCLWGSCRLSANLSFKSLVRWQSHMDEEHQQALKHACHHRGCKSCFADEDELKLHTAAEHQIQHRTLSKTTERPRMLSIVSQQTEEEDLLMMPDDQDSQDGELDLLDSRDVHTEPVQAQEAAFLKASPPAVAGWAECTDILDLKLRETFPQRQTVESTPRREVVAAPPPTSTRPLTTQPTNVTSDSQPWFTII